MLRDTLVQLRFPIRQGISSETSYRGATLKGERPPETGGLELVAPDGLSLRLHPSLAGAIPVLGVSARADFEALVRALTARNEPVPVPQAMGACLVNGLNNWDRIRRLEARWRAQDPGERDARTWAEAFRRIVQQPALYKDRMIVLSRGPYSGVASSHVGMDEDEWQELSVAVRLEHECAHALTLKVFGALRHDMLEELVADWAALIAATGGYRVELARRFLGIEAHPAFRPGGRLEIYRGSPPMSDRAFGVARRLAVDATATLNELAADGEFELDRSDVLARLTVALLTLPIESVAGSGAVERIRSQYEGLEDALAEPHGGRR